MIKVEHMGASPSQAKSKKGNHVCPEENTSEQGHEIGSEYLLTELFENNNQCGHAITRNESTEIATGVSCSSIHKSSSEYVANGSCPEPLRLLPKGVSEHNHTDQSFCAQETVPGKTHEYHSGYVHKETSEKKHQPGSEIVKIKLEESRSWVCGLPAKHSKPFSKGLSKNAITEGLGLSTAGSNKDNIRREPSKPPEQGPQLELESLPNSTEQSTTAVSTNVFNQALQLNPEDTNKSNCDKLLQSPSQGAHNVIQSKIEDMAKNSSVEQHETTSENFSQSKDGKTLKTIKKKYMLRSSTNNDRALPSNSQEKSKPGQLSNNLVDVASSEQRQRRKKKRREKREVVDEYSRIRGHLRYLLNRISYERSLIAVYSAEGWKGQSLEKLKPEKELQRATSEILRRKLKIKDLFKRIDSLCAEGRLPESLFDSEGQIDSEDIFCAKCGSKDLSPNNDIILCDGACDRGFHQYCLQPPLLKEDIPPDDEGWLCPGCDCKVDCIQLLNEFQGTSFSLTDNWEKVFPEALVSEDGENQHPNFRLRSDDSNDHDYNPDGSETGEKGEGDESSSDESDFTFSFEEWEVPANVDPNLGEFPSDDAEGDDDDDYDPNGSNHDTETSRESSSSDFTFDSEDLGYMLEDDIASQKDEDPMSNCASTVSKRRKSKCGGKESLKDELLSILESTSEQDGAAVSKKRNNERLDYKRLYDETYGNIPSSSSDDEDWNDATTSRKRMKCTIRATPTLSNGNACASRSEETNFNDTDLSLAEEGGVTVSGSSGKKWGSSTYRRLGEAVKQRLNESFKENQYPDRSTKKSLAKELDITFHQVSKWFDNARWSFNNSSSIHETATEKVSENEIPSALETKN